MVNDEVTTNDIMEFLEEYMVTKEEHNQLSQKLNQTKLDLLDAMDEKLGNLKGDLVVLMRKEDQKVNDLIKLLVLVKRKLISDNEAVTLIETRPFPQSTG